MRLYPAEHGIGVDDPARSCWTSTNCIEEERRLWLENEILRKLAAVAKKISTPQCRVTVGPCSPQVQAGFKQPA